MATPIFYHDGLPSGSSEIPLAEETAKHVVQVLRMSEGEVLKLTDGKGIEAITTISRIEKRKCFVIIDDIKLHAPSKTHLHLCVAFTKNANRNEWLLEKATELGVSSITPIVASRTEREKIRYDRCKNILIAALIQSQQYYLPNFSEAQPLKEILHRFNGVSQKLIGHCIADEPKMSLSKAMKKAMETVILIGPEGDFTIEEVLLSKENGFTGIAMGTQRLRTETAAIAVCAYFNLINL